MVKFSGAVVMGLNGGEDEQEEDERDHGIEAGIKFRKGSGAAGGATVGDEEVSYPPDEEEKG